MKCHISYCISSTCWRKLRLQSHPILVCISLLRRYIYVSSSLLNKYTLFYVLTLKSFTFQKSIFSFVSDNLVYEFIKISTEVVDTLRPVIVVLIFSSEVNESFNLVNDTNQSFF